MRSTSRSRPGTTTSYNCGSSSMNTSSHYSSLNSLDRLRDDPNYALPPPSSSIASEKIEPAAVSKPNMDSYSNWFPTRLLPQIPPISMPKTAKNYFTRTSKSIQKTLSQTGTHIAHSISKVIQPNGQTIYDHQTGIPSFKPNQQADGGIFSFLNPSYDPLLAMGNAAGSMKTDFFVASQYGAKAFSGPTEHEKNVLFEREKLDYDKDVGYFGGGLSRLGDFFNGIGYFAKAGFDGASKLIKGDKNTTNRNNIDIASRNAYFHNNSSCSTNIYITNPHTLFNSSFNSTKQVFSQGFDDVKSTLGNTAYAARLSHGAIFDAGKEATKGTLQTGK